MTHLESPNHGSQKGEELTVVIPTHNRKDLLKNCLTSLFKQNYPKDKYEIIVIDDGSTDGTEEMIKGLKSPCKLRYFRIRKSGNRSKVRNVGIKNAKNRIILFLDSDMISSPNLIRYHIEMHKKYDKCVILGYRKNVYDFKRKFFGDDKREIRYYNNKLNKLFVPWYELHSHNFSVKRQDILKVGMFDEDFKGWGLEDLELGYRLNKLKLKFILNRKAIGYHQYHLPTYRNMFEKQKQLKENSILMCNKHPIMNSPFKDFIKFNGETLILWNICNNNCIFCDISGRKGKKNKTTNGIKEELSSITNHEELIISGGEPTIRKDIFDIVKYAKQLGFKKITLDTNGRMFYYKDFCEKMIKAGVEKFIIYLNGHNAKIHDKITRVNGSFEQTIEGIKNLKESSKEIQINIVINKMNYRNLLSMIDILNWLMIKSVLFIVLKPEGDLIFKNFIPNYAEIAPFAQRVVVDNTRSEVKPSFLYL